MKYAIIMRGVPGSGKGAVAVRLEKVFRVSGYTTVVHSTNDLCGLNIEYERSLELCAKRNAGNFNDFCSSMNKGVDVVVCDNTNVKVSQFQPYIDAAHKANYTPFIVELPHPDAEAAASRNTHGVSIDVINQMLLAWETSQPLVTVGRLEHALRIVSIIQRRAKLTFFMGLLLGALCSGLAAIMAGG